MKILYRDIFKSNEFKIASKYLPTTDSILDIKENDLVIGRYSVLPFYKEVERDINRLNAKLINTYEQHLYLADLENWYKDLQHLTPKTWFASHEVPKNEAPFIVKGATNSKKWLWDTHMYAETWEDMVQVCCRLRDDGLIEAQNICIRKYVPLHTYFKSLHGLPITKEFRFFVLYGEIVAGGFYWSNHMEEIGEIPDINEVSELFLKKIIGRIGDYANFYVLDIAQTQNSEWVLIELNDGQMSGLSEINPDEFYKKLGDIANERDRK